MGSRRSLTLGLAGSIALLANHPIRGTARQDTPPPHMVLRSASGGEQEGGIGTYCWGTECVDMGSTPFPRCSLLVTAGEALTMDVSAIGRIRRLHYTIWDLAKDELTGDPSWSGRIDVMPTHDREIAPVLMPFNLPPGLYAIEVFTRLRSRGDTYQGFKLLVQPASSAATPEASTAATPSSDSICTGSYQMAEATSQPARQ